MNAENSSVEVSLRIPGAWSNPGELLDRLPAGFRLTPESLFLPDGTAIEFIPMPPDNQFAQIFRSSCRRPATEKELATVDRYQVNIGLKGPAGSLQSALTLLQAGAAIVRAGGAGVFIDNSALAHGGSQWIDMAEDGGPDAVSFAFVSIVSGKQEIYTTGMHVLGYPEIVMRLSDREADAETIIEVVRYVARGDQPLGDGHLLGDELGPRFQATSAPSPAWSAGSPLHNPFGCLRLTSLKDIAQDN